MEHFLMSCESPTAHKLKNTPLACLNQGEKHAGWVWVGRGGKSANGRALFAGVVLIIHSASHLLNINGGENGGKILIRSVVFSGNMLTPFAYTRTIPSIHDNSR